MASSSTVSTPQPSNDLPRLPAEIWAQIFDNLESLENFQSLISASSTALGYFQDDKSHTLRPFVENINDHTDTDIIPILLSSFKVRKLLFKTPGPTLSQIGDELSAFLNPLFRPDTPNPFQQWDQNLSAVIKLTKGFRKIAGAMWYYTGIRDNLWRRMSSFPLPSQSEAPRSEVKKFLVTFVYQTILLDLSTYRDGTLFNPRTSILDSVAWEAANPNLEDVTPNLWQPSSDQAGALVINDRGLVHVAVEIARGLHRGGEEAEGGYTQLMPVANNDSIHVGSLSSLHFPPATLEELRLKQPGSVVGFSIADARILFVGSA
ncbi:hypothetical protein FPHYL_12498 [Fusarium phyllophilum]|uniref:Uncharacterized protein n=1 Tax=Fusarium phyllophilum TaxID=47803 RepID=A0A8H5MRY7_9HYPO|nr:hypothetical protein FPHYL_12498 [Fusarium phyllophilum]